MGKRKKTKRLDLDSVVFDEMLMPAIVLAIILLIAITGVSIISKIDFQGAGYFFAVFDLFLVLVISFPYALKNIMADMIRSRVIQKQYRSAKDILNAGLLVLILYSVICVVLLMVLANSMTRTILWGTKCIITFWILSGIIVFYSITCAFMGYFEGMEETFAVIFPTFVGHIIMIFSCILFSNIFLSKGIKASNVLHSQVNRYAYGAAGAAIGILVTAIVICLVTIAMYQMYGNYYRKLLRKDISRRREDALDILIRLIMKVLPVAGSFLVFLGFQIIDQWIFIRNSSQIIVSSYQWGSYVGVFRCALIIPLLMVFVFASKDRIRIVSAMDNKDKHEVRIKCNYILKDSMIISLFFGVMCLVLGNKIVQGFYGMDSALAGRILRIGAIGIVLYSFSAAILVLLQAVNSAFTAFLTGAIALLANAATAYVTVTFLGMGIYGIVLSFLVYGVVYVSLGLYTLRHIIRGKLDLYKIVIRPAVATVILGFISFLLSLVLGLFLPPIFNIIITSVIGFIVYFCLLSILDVISVYSVSTFPFGGILVRMGKILGLFR